MTDLEIQKLLLDKRQYKKAFEHIFNLYHMRLYGHIRKMVLLHDDAHDVTQNSFMKIYENLPNFKGNSSIFTWIFRIGTNEALQFLRQKASVKKYSVEEYTYITSTRLATDIYFDGDDALLKLHQSIAQLPEKQRLVFQMRYFEELPYEAISTILETSVGALKANYHHAVTKLKNDLNLNL